MVRPMRKTRAPTQSQRAIGHIAALQSIATMFVMHAMVGRSTLQFKMPRLDAYLAVEGLRLRRKALQANLDVVTFFAGGVDAFSNACHVFFPSRV